MKRVRFQHVMLNRGHGLAPEHRRSDPHDRVTFNSALLSARFEPDPSRVRHFHARNRALEIWSGLSPWRSIATIESPLSATLLVAIVSDQSPRFSLIQLGKPGGQQLHESGFP